MAIRLAHEGKVYGVLSVSSPLDVAEDKEVQSLFQEVAGDLAFALHSIKLDEERKQAEELFKSLAANSPVGVYIVQEGKFVYASPQFQRDSGYREDELLGMEALSLVFPDDRETVRNNAVQMLKGKRIVPYEFKAIDKNGEMKWTLESVASIQRQGKQAAIGSYQDISERKKAEQQMLSLQEQLRQSQKMEAIGRLAGGVAHDFNNLLTVISIQSQLSVLGLREGDPLRENLQEIEKAADRAADLTRQLLAFSRHQILEMKVLNLNFIVSDLEKMLHRIIGEDLELASILADDLGMVKVDPGQMEQVIVNLAVNAKDAMPQGGQLTIETTNVELDGGYTRTHMGVVPGAYVMLSITDTGVGMTREIKEQIFDPFFTTKEKGKGTGLGLSTVYGIVKQSGGDIYVYSEPNQGTAFKIYFPRVFEPGEEWAKKEAVGEISRGEETILVVEDDGMVRKLAINILRMQGYTVLEAEAGGEALLMCEQYKDPIDLILTDIVMPHMGGPELIERLKQVRKDFKALFMTGYTDETIVQQGILEKGIELINKPFTIQKLSRKVREVLDKN
jgi:PAS domain S-box